MGSVVLNSVRKSYGDAHVIKDVSLTIPDGEFCVLVGPSGCGKSTLLRMIAGLEEISGGEVHINERNVTEVEPKLRDIAMVFQSYALYPQMTVRENMGFALKMARLPKADINQKVNEAAALLGLEPLLERLPKDLSGGQRQRVAMGLPLCVSRRCSCLMNRYRISTPNYVPRCVVKYASCIAG